MRIPTFVLCLLPVAVATCATAQADDSLMSKTYKFKPGVVLDIGASSPSGLRLDTVRFVRPEDRALPLRIGSALRAEVTVSNLASAPRRVGIAIALFDEGGRLLGVASGGSALMAIKSDRQSTYSLSFKDVNDLAATASSFQISLEPK